MEDAEALQIRSMPVAKTLVASQVVRPDKKATFAGPNILSKASLYALPALGTWKYTWHIAAGDTSRLPFSKRMM